jgi:hypothetical protein
MTTTTVPPVFPGTIGDHLDQTGRSWELFADATLTHQPEAREMGRKLARSASHRKPNRRRSSIAKGITTALLIAAALGATAPRANAAVHSQAGPSITVDTPAVHGGGYVKLSIRFGACVRNVRAWVTSGDDGPDNTRVNRVDASEARPGEDFTVWVGIDQAAAASMPGTWYVGSVQWDGCGSGAQGADYIAVPPLFRVAS